MVNRGRHTILKDMKKFYIQLAIYFLSHFIIHINSILAFLYFYIKLRKLLILILSYLSNILSHFLYLFSHFFLFFASLAVRAVNAAIITHPHLIFSHHHLYLFNSFNILKLYIFFQLIHLNLSTNTIYNLLNDYNIQDMKYIEIIELRH